MPVATILGLIKVALDVFHEERKNRYLKRYIQIQKEFDDEVRKGIENWSDLKLDELRDEATKLAKLIIAEARDKSA